MKKIIKTQSNLIEIRVIFMNDPIMIQVNLSKKLNIDNFLNINLNFLGIRIRFRFINLLIKFNKFSNFFFFNISKPTIKNLAFNAFQSNIFRCYFPFILE